MSAENQPKPARSKQESVIPGFNTDGTKQQKKQVNSALAAEREKARLIKTAWDDAAVEIGNLQQQLAAEREKTFAVSRHLEDAKKDLLQAQAAIAELQAFIKRCGDHMICGSNIADTPIPTEQEWRDILAKPDLSALDRHDAEVRKTTHGYSIGYATAKTEYEAHLTPLVDALEKLRKEIAPMAAQIICPKDNTFTRQLSVIADALAKVKEGK